AQTMGEEEKEKDKAVAQTMDEEDKEKDENMAQSMHEGSETSQTQKKDGNVEELLAQTKGKGSPLPRDLKIRMEEKFGAKFHKVRIHTGEDAVQLTRMLKAKAFTHGYDIYFNEGEFNPYTYAGEHLLAHELAHTFHQNGNNQST
ncbi:MAG: DUF4157 domain-containing protein, partial [Bacteroidetes bacterium]|nr:DUF4157 domain-containing protein [Bacteroidota bacterium]